MFFPGISSVVPAYLEPEELAVWQVLSDAETDDYLTVTEIAAIGSAISGRRIQEYTVRETVAPMLRLGSVTRVSVYRRGRQQSQWGYRLTADGRVRAVRILAQ